TLKLAKWLFFEIAFALLPFFFAWKALMVRGEEFTWAKIVGQGELLLVAVAIVAAGMGDLLAEGIQGRLRSTKFCRVGFSILLMVASANFYGDLAGRSGTVKGWLAEWNLPASFSLAGAALVLNLASLIAAEVQ